MIHIKNGLKKRSKRIRKNAKGLRGVSKGNLRNTIQRTEKALQYYYSHIKGKKRDYRNLWITRINAGAREHGMTYSKFMCGLSVIGLNINRKMLSELVVNEPFTFRSLVEEVKWYTRKNSL